MYLCNRQTKECEYEPNKKVLETKGISQTELANRLGKTFNMVNLYATNKVQPPIPVLYRIADILKIDVRELLIPNKLDIK